MGQTAVTNDELMLMLVLGQRAESQRGKGQIGKRTTRLLTTGPQRAGARSGEMKRLYKNGSTFDRDEPSASVTRSEVRGQR
jgi:hypothetical protein